LTAEQRRDASAVVRLRDVHFSVSRRAIFGGVDVDIGRGSVTAIMGPSGTGKTTLLRLITGQLMADRGLVEVEGRGVAKMSGPRSTVRAGAWACCSRMAP
jgi:phospholipid/cholesterol/gamma-HCH transport system ATP-binding protein